ncbi:PAS domain S-box protein [Undibacterium sp. LX40W]|uniref:histidine kinase n=1 Tax=Undibacterium nitidum TaxID=2762298 RepID=A0A923HRV6_9BURK|nr:MULTISPECIES: ATP-binding protein [Undibacterium]MBC3882170.1 PAS domain S-box protein [Undibacterium nitidum]MBC3892451.1 PAS domain S-box protein [Undibacterium sp. LX40W]
MRRLITPWLPLLLLVGVVIATELLLFEEVQRQKSLTKQNLISHAGEIRALLESELNSSIHLATGMVSYIQAKNGHYEKDEIQVWMHNLQKSETNIRNIAIAPGNRIHLVAPLQGNESVIGLYYPDNPAQWPAVQKIIQSKTAALAGPFELKQGGLGLAYRVPVFINNNEYWGLVSTVLDVKSVFSKVTKRASELKMNIGLQDLEASTSDANLSSSKIIWSSGKTEFDDSVALNIDVPGRNLKLLSQYSEYETSAWLTWGIRLIGWTIGALLSFLLARIIRSYRLQSIAAIALNESREQFMRAFTTAPQGMALLSIKGRWLNINPTLLAILGYTEEEMHDISSDSLAPELHVEHLLKHWRHQDNNSLQYEIALQRKDESYVTCLISIALIEGRKLEQGYWIFQVIDMSARIAAETKLQDSAEYTQAILDNVADGIVSTNLQGEIKSINPAALAIWKIPEFNFIPYNFFSRLYRDDNLKVREQLEHFLEGCEMLRPGQIPTLNIESNITDAIGNQVDIEISVTATERKDHVELIFVVRDISARKQLELMQSEFVSIVSHELRTPLTSIIGSLRLMEGGVFGKLPDALDKMIRIALQNGQQLALIINDILDMDKLAAGKMEFTIQEHHIRELLAQAMETNQSYAKQYQVKFVLESEHDYRIRCDGQRFQQIMSNLLSNAAKYSKPDSHIDIRLTPHENTLEIAVCDYGEGIPIQFQDKIFKKFSQVDGSSTRKKGGTGLGLSICKEMVQRMEGEIGFSSEEGVGSTFYFRLPLIKESSVA